MGREPSPRRPTRLHEAHCSSRHADIGSGLHRRLRQRVPSPPAAVTARSEVTVTVTVKVTEDRFAGRASRRVR